MWQYKNSIHVRPITIQATSRGSYISFKNLNKYTDTRIFTLQRVKNDLIQSHTRAFDTYIKRYTIENKKSNASTQIYNHI